MTNIIDITGNQRWLERRATFRRPDELIDVRAHEVAPIADDKTARAFVTRHHYSGSFPAARFRFGLYERGDLVGVAVFSQPVRDEVVTNVFPTIPRLAGVELGRFVLLDRVAGNGETWFLARTFELLRRAGIAGVVSFSDPMPRTRLDGTVVMPGHLGTIYQAANAAYLGRGRADTLRLLPDGTVFARRTYQKIRAGERGWIPAAAVLARYGAEPIDAGASEPERRAWLESWMGQLTRPMKHGGNHRYAWVVDPRQRRAADPVPYGPRRAFPKTRDAAEVRQVVTPCRYQRQPELMAA